LSGSQVTGAIVKIEPSRAREAELIAAAREGDMRAFEHLYRSHSGKVMGLCLRMTRRRDVAEDCVQQTFIQAWRKLDAFEGRSNFGTWLHRIAVNQVLARSRSHETRDESDEEATTLHATTVSERTDGVGDMMDLERALALLPRGARHVVVLQTVYGYSHEEVAEMLGVAVGTCKAQLHRGRQQLRRLMGLVEVDDE
jgi:RNA polymerase sigma-70 factor (ECF subfamily)